MKAAVLVFALAFSLESSALPRCGRVLSWLAGPSNVELAERAGVPVALVEVELYRRGRIARAVFSSGALTAGIAVGFDHLLSDVPLSTEVGDFVTGLTASAVVGSVGWLSGPWGTARRYDAFASSTLLAFFAHAGETQIGARVAAMVLGSLAAISVDYVLDVVGRWSLARSIRRGTFGYGRD